MNSQAICKSITPQFTVSDVVETAEYYRDVLGFEIRGYWKEPPVFAIVARDSAEIFFNLAEPGVLPRTGRAPGAYDAYLTVRGIDALAAALVAQGAEIIDGPETREYGMRELVVRECNGLILAFGEDAQASAT